MLCIEQGTLYQHLMRIRKHVGGHSVIELLYILNGHCKIDVLDQLHLTPRGKKIFCLIIAGATNKDIADHFGISKSGVRRHREKMLLQNGCDSMLELISKYYLLQGHGAKHEN